MTIRERFKQGFRNGYEVVVLENRKRAAVLGGAASIQTDAKENVDRTQKMYLGADERQKELLQQVNGIAGRVGYRAGRMAYHAADIAGM